MKNSKRKPKNTQEEGGCDSFLMQQTILNEGCFPRMRNCETGTHQKTRFLVGNILLSVARNK
jgi:hypothetical protein